MLFRLIFIRLFPLLILNLCRERRTVKIVSSILLFGSLLLFLIASGEILRQRGVKGVFYLLAALLPHTVFYLFALWILLRCIWQEWSQRVWQRIYLAAMVCILCGIFMETYWNPAILRFFEKIFK